MLPSRFNGLAEVLFAYSVGVSVTFVCRLSLMKAALKLKGQRDAAADSNAIIIVGVSRPQEIEQQWVKFVLFRQYTYLYKIILLEISVDVNYLNDS